MAFPLRTELDVAQPVVVGGREAVTYDFQSIAPGVAFSIPPDSAWQSPAHWHKTSGSCEYILVPARSDHTGPRVLLQKSLLPQIVDARYLGRYEARYPQPELEMRPMERVSWKPYAEKRYGFQGHSTEILLRTVDPACAQALYRNLCGVTIDASIYPRLQSTPTFVRGLWRLLGGVPPLQRQFERFILELQITAILRANDFWVVRWSPRIGWLWWWRFWDGPPRWVPSFERSISDVVSVGIMILFSFIAIRLLGMKTDYHEYMAVPVDEKNVSV